MSFFVLSPVRVSARKLACVWVGGCSVSASPSSRRSRSHPCPGDDNTLHINTSAVIDIDKHAPLMCALLLLLVRACSRGVCAFSACRFDENLTVCDGGGGTERVHLVRFFMRRHRFLWSVFIVGLESDCFYCA